MGNLGETSKARLAARGIRLGLCLFGMLRSRSGGGDLFELGDDSLAALLSRHADHGLHVIAPARNPNENKTRYADRSSAKRKRGLEGEQTRNQRKTDRAGAKVVA